MCRAVRSRRCPRSGAPAERAGEVAAARTRAYLPPMNPVLRKVLIAAAIVVLIVGGLTLWVLHGRPAEHTVDEVSGKNPVLVEQDAETFPSTGLAKPLGWRANEAPVPAKG